MSDSTRRVIGQKDRDNARRLNNIWTSKKEALNLNQTKLAKLCGMTQPTVNQYLNAIIPLNTDAIFKFAAVLEVNPVDIAPEFKKVSPLFSLQKHRPSKRLFAVIGSVSGEKTVPVQELTVDDSTFDPQGSYVALVVDNHQYIANYGLNPGATVILNLLDDPFIKGADIAIRLKGQDRFDLVKVAKTTRDKVHILYHSTNKKSVLLLADILQAYKIHSTIHA